MKGFFGDLFDMNHDGKLDGFEEAADFAAFATMMDSINKTGAFEETEEEEAESELEAAGLDAKDLEFMDEDERREAIEDAGLDPDDFDF